MNDPEVDKNRWHLKKEVQISHIVTTLLVSASVLLYVSKLEQRIALIEAQDQMQRDRDERQDRATTDARDALRSQLERMDAKLDRLIEKGMRP